MNKIFAVYNVFYEKHPLPSVDYSEPIYFSTKEKAISYMKSEYDESDKQTLYVVWALKTLDIDLLDDDKDYQDEKYEYYNQKGEYLFSDYYIPKEIESNDLLLETLKYKSGDLVYFNEYENSSYIPEYFFEKQIGIISLLPITKEDPRFDEDDIYSCYTIVFLDKDGFFDHIHNEESQIEIIPEEDYNNLVDIELLKEISKIIEENPRFVDFINRRDIKDVNIRSGIEEYYKNAKA